MMPVTVLIETTLKEFMKQFQFIDNYGRQWEVPLLAVEKDYREYLAAYNDPQPESIPESDLTTWFNEQFSWFEIKRDGKIVKDLTNDEKLKLFDFFINDSLYTEIQSGADVEWKLTDSVSKP